MAAATPSAVSSNTATSLATTPTINASAPGLSRESGQTLPSTAATARTTPDRGLAVMLVRTSNVFKKDGRRGCGRGLVLADILLIWGLIGIGMQKTRRTKAEGKVIG